MVLRSVPLPAQFRQKIPSGARFFRVKEALVQESLHTVCEEAKCPNRTDCYARGTLTFQILGNRCTRRCGFCAELTAKPLAPDWSEPERIVAAARKLALKHVVVTAPARDDLADGGAEMFARVVALLKQELANVSVEVLVSDLNQQVPALDKVLNSPLDVFNHNLETVERLTPKVRGRATYRGSLTVLAHARKFQPRVKTKSGLMVGLGETRAELYSAIIDLVNAGVNMVTIGHYLPPSPEHLPAEKIYSDLEFAEIKDFAQAQNFMAVQCGPLVRSSYHADELV